MKRIAIITVIGVSLVAAAILVAFVLVPAVVKKPGPDQKFGYPIEWRFSSDPDMGNEGPARIVLHEDGAAELLGVAMGQVEQNAEGRFCVSVSGEPVFGTASWRIDDIGALRISGDFGDAIFVPGRARFSGPDWSELREEFCDDSYVDFSPISAAR